MIKFEKKNKKEKKKKKKKCQLTLLRRSVPAACFHPFFNFSDSPLLREAIKILSSLRKSGVRTMRDRVLHVK